MRVITLTIIIVCVILLIESVYCYAMKRYSKKNNRITKKDDDSVKYNGPQKISIFKIKRIIIGIANDITFFMFKIVGYVPCHVFRKLIYRFIFHMSIGKRTVIYYGLEARSPWNITIDEGSIIGDHAILDARYGISIGKNVNLSTGVWMWTLQHDVNSKTFGVENQAAGITIGDRAWISSRTVLLPGCDISEGCVVAAGAVITKKCDIEFGIYGGIPAKLISKRNKEINYEFDGKHRHFL